MLKILLFFITCFVINLQASTIAHWKFDNDFASEVNPNFNGTSIGNVAFSNDSSPATADNTSLDFNGGYVRMDNTTNITGGLTTLTIEAFIKPDTANQFGTIFSEDIPSEPRAIYLGYMGTSNAIRFFVNVGAGFEVLDAIVPDLSDDWHHVAAEFDGNNQTISVFLDGSLVDSRSVSISTLSVSPVNPTIGIWSGDQSSFAFDGKIDEVKLTTSTFNAPIPEPSSIILLTFASFIGLFFSHLHRRI